MKSVTVQLCCLSVEKIYLHSFFDHGGQMKSVTIQLCCFSLEKYTFTPFLIMVVR